VVDYFGSRFLHSIADYMHMHCSFVLVGGNYIICAVTFLTTDLVEVCGCGVPLYEASSMRPLHKMQQYWNGVD
jgi:hypothetical protein